MLFRSTNDKISNAKKKNSVLNLNKNFINVLIFEKKESTSNKNRHTTHPTDKSSHKITTTRETPIRTTLWLLIHYSERKFKSTRKRIQINVSRKKIYPRFSTPHRFLLPLHVAGHQPHGKGYQFYWTNAYPTLSTELHHLPTRYHE